MKDCGCEKGKETENWPSEKEVGDDFLFEEGTDMIKSIKKNLKFVKMNPEAIFNKKMDEDQLSALVLDDTVIDYSYLGGEDETMINYDVNQTPLLQDEVESVEESEVESVTSEVESVEESEVESATSEVESVEESEVEPDTIQMENFKIIREEEEPVEVDTEYQERLKYSSRTDAEKYLNDLL